MQKNRVFKIFLAFSCVILMLILAAPHEVFAGITAAEENQSVVGRATPTPDTRRRKTKTPTRVPSYTPTPVVPTPTLVPSLVPSITPTIVDAPLTSMPMQDTGLLCCGAGATVVLSAVAVNGYRRFRMRKGSLQGASGFPKVAGSAQAIEGLETPVVIPPVPAERGRLRRDADGTGIGPDQIEGLAGAEGFVKMAGDLSDFPKLGEGEGASEQMGKLFPKVEINPVIPDTLSEFPKTPGDLSAFPKLGEEPPGGPEDFPKSGDGMVKM